MLTLENRVAQVIGAGGGIGSAICVTLARQTAYDLSASAHALGRMAEPSEIAAGVRFLASGGASYMHSAELILDGGYSAR